MSHASDSALRSSQAAGACCRLTPREAVLRFVIRRLEIVRSDASEQESLFGSRAQVMHGMILTVRPTFAPHVRMSYCRRYHPLAQRPEVMLFACVSDNRHEPMCSWHLICERH